MPLFWVFWVGLLLAGCGLAPGTPVAPAGEEPLQRPAATRSLPPAPTGTASPTPLRVGFSTPEAPRDWGAAQAMALLPGFVADVERAPTATRYIIDVQVNFAPWPTSAVIQGVARIRFTNPAPGPLRELVVMLWPNDGQYQASMRAGPAWVEGSVVELEALGGGVAHRLRLPDGLSSGSTIDVTLPFEVEVYGPIRDSAPKRFGITKGVLIAPTFYPLLPRLVQGSWQVEAAPEGGDTTSSDLAFYEVRFTTPEAFSLAATGSESAARTTADGRRLTTYVSGPVRDVAFALGPLVEVGGEAGPVALRAWVLEEHLEDAPRMLDAAAAQMAAMSELLGPYPYRELDLVDAPGAFGGIEYPGLVFIGSVGGPSVVEPTVHEVAHQWFYGLIGNDQLMEPWLDEAAATYAQVLYYERAARGARATALLADWREVVRSSSDPTRPVGLPVSGYATPQEYGTIVYLKGALFFEALRTAVGDETFFQILHAYAEGFRYGFATTGDFHRTAERACACELDDLFELWVYGGGPLPVP